ncbi:MAG: tRNA guanosine(15) transglycosylase TgtA [Desulfocapsa sp.]|nr:MAG: tRNA guanosine(15) transglycosylase TgtA [Desulfocapsa sp.]
MNFEILDKDVMGRIGKLKTPHGTIETPTIMPVINPNIEFIPAKEMRKFGAQIVITNAYIIYRTPQLREVALEKGVHGLLDVDMPIMTDSGSYQLMMYGDVEVTNETILKFQTEIGSDIIVPLDIPTPPDADYNTALSDLEETIKRERQAVKFKGRSLLAIPIQGSTHWDLRRKSAEEAVKIGGDVYAIGGIVPLMDTYRFYDVVKIILEVKSVLPSYGVVHLFGAGHPMIFALAVALGCDLFDSAAYALYAKDDRYLTPYGTKKLEELQYFPCSCPICNKYTPQELREMEKEERERLLAEHNLYTSFEEIRRIKQAIKENTLFELVEKRVRAHPNLLHAWRQIKDYGHVIELYDPSIKHSFFYTGVESCYRPAVKRHHEKVLQIEIEKQEIVISSDEGELADFYLKPAFGVVPAEMIESYPAGHAEIPPAEFVEEEALRIAVEALKMFLEHHSDKMFKILVNEVWLKHLRDLPENAVVECLSKREGLD